MNIASTPEAGSHNRLHLLINEGITLFNNQHWQRALTIFDQVAKIDPRNAAVYNYRARSLESLGRLEESLYCIDIALAIVPGNAADLRNRAIVLSKLGRLEEAAAAYDTAVRLRPNDTDLLVRRAAVLDQINRRMEALVDANQAVALRPNDPDILNTRVIVLHHLGRYADALADIDRILYLRPNHLDAINNCGMMLAQLGRFHEALDCYNRSLSINPDQPQAVYNRSLIRAIVLTKLGCLEEAATAYDTAVRLRPNDADLLVRRAAVLNQIDRRTEALVDANQAVAVRPNDPDILNARVISLHNLGRYTEALADIDRMLYLRPNHLDAINNSGMVLAQLGRFQEALDCYNRSLSINPDQPQAVYNRSLIRLSLGDWIRGFQEFETRWNTALLNRNRSTGLGPLWLGGEENLVNKTLLLYHEQGYGDTLQCARYAPLLADRGAKVIVAVPPALRSLMHSLHGVTAVVAEGQLPPHDYQSPFMSMPLAFRTTPDTIPAPIPYLSANPTKIGLWRERLGQRIKPRIGLAWSGRKYAPISYARDIPLVAMKSLLLFHAQFVSLQKDIAESDRSMLGQLPQLEIYSDMLSDFDDTAALMMHLDLIITVDTAVAHLAGALGRPVWLLNRIGTCWRWLQEGADSPWYPTLRQFRQPAAGDWTSVIADVRHALEDCFRGATLFGPDMVALDKG